MKRTNFKIFSVALLLVAVTSLLAPPPFAVPVRKKLTFTSLGAEAYLSTATGNVNTELYMYMFVEQGLGENGHGPRVFISISNYHGLPDYFYWHTPYMGYYLCKGDVYKWSPTEVTILAVIPYYDGTPLVFAAKFKATSSRSRIVFDDEGLLTTTYSRNATAIVTWGRKQFRMGWTGFEVPPPTIYRTVFET